MEIKIRDFAFAHTDYSTLQKSKYFKWIRTNEQRNVCFFTDTSLEDARYSNDKIKVAWLLEPRAINPHIYSFVEKNHNLFDYILTYDKKLLEISEKFLFYAHGGCWINDDDKKITEKTKFCSIIASGKRQTEGHVLRHDVISALSGKIDVFGNGYKRIENKIEALKDYKFSIVIENSIQDDYFTEKLIDNIITGTIPLYWGTNNVNNYFKNIPTFKSIDELTQLIHYYENNEYDSIFIKENFELASKYNIPEDYIFENYNFLFN